MKNKLSKQRFEDQFLEVIELIKKSRNAALNSVNTELIDLYWRIGGYISNKLKNAEWGESVVSQLAGYIQNKYPEYKGYSDKNLWRMKQFYETYKDSKLSALLRELNWTNNLLILSKAKSEEEKEFDLSISKYRDIEYEEIRYESPEKLKKQILELEEGIIKDLKEINI